MGILKEVTFLVLLGFNSTEEIAKTAEEEEDRAIDIALEGGVGFGDQGWNRGRESGEVWG